MITTPRATQRGLAALAALAAIAFGALPAYATTGSDDLWYFTQSGMADLHQQTRGAGIDIAILDSQIDASFADLAGADLQVREPSYCATENGGPAQPASTTASEALHGTGVATMLLGNGSGAPGSSAIAGIAPDSTVRYYAIHIGNADTNVAHCEVPAGFDATEQTTDVAAFRQAIADGADIIVVSSGAVFGADLVADALRAGVIVVAAAGNSANAPLTWLAKQNGVVAVGSIDSSLALWENNPSSPYLAVNAPGVDLRVPNQTFTGYGIGSGSSLASPYTAGALALSWSVHPDATANQMIQALIRTTGGEVHEPYRDDAWGYGLVSARALVAIDPTTLPDENPLLTDEPGREPTRAEVLGLPMESPSATAAPSAEPTTAPAPEADADPESNAGTTSMLLIGGGLVLVIGLVALTFILLRRRPTAGTDHPGGHDGQEG